MLFYPRQKYLQGRFPTFQELKYITIQKQAILDTQHQPHCS